MISSPKAILLPTIKAFFKRSKAKMKMVRIRISLSLNKVPVPTRQQNKRLDALNLSCHLPSYNHTLRLAMPLVHAEFTISSFNKTLV